MKTSDVVLYWDSSAVLSAVFRDVNSGEAMSRARNEGVHLLSSLAWAEAHAVISRMQRERAAADVLIEAAREALANGPWRRVYLEPEWQLVTDLALRWPLRGADLWHLATAKTLQAEIPELRMFSFDGRLVASAQGVDLT